MRKTLARPSDATEIRERLKAMRPDRERRWGVMTAPQMICHLSDSFLAVSGRMYVSSATGLLQRTLIKWFALYAPIPWPHGLDTRPELDQQGGRGTKPGVFTADVGKLAALLEEVTRAPSSFGWTAHPLFGRMSTAEWLRWGYLHMDHHFRQFGV